MVISTEAERRAFMPVQAESCSVNGRVVVVVAGAATTELVKTTAGQVQERQRGKVSKRKWERGALAKQIGHRPESVSYSAAEQCVLYSVGGDLAGKVSVISQAVLVCRLFSKQQQPHIIGSLFFFFNDSNIIITLTIIVTLCTVCTSSVSQWCAVHLITLIVTTRGVKESSRKR